MKASTGLGFGASLRVHLADLLLCYASRIQADRINRPDSIYEYQSELLVHLTSASFMNSLKWLTSFSCHLIASLLSVSSYCPTLTSFQNSG